MMRRYSPPYRSPPRRGYGGRGRSPPRRGYGGYGGRKEPSHGSLLVRNIPLSYRPEDIRVPFERFGPVRDVYLPRDYYTGEPRGFAFVEFVDPYDASEAQYHMNRQLFGGREITVVVAAETRKRPEEMRSRARIRGPSGDGRRSSYYGRSRSRSVSRSRSPRYSSRARPRSSRSNSPGPRRRGDYSASPRRKGSHHARSPRHHEPKERDEDRNRRSYSPRGKNGHQRESDNGFDERLPRHNSGSPPGSRSRSADLSPGPSI
ncbi:serine/arginine-rich SC35-like splicing factor SCL30 isoform X1 [Ananas comosus]|uniref:Serine/arginine-rich SC35-like splicing factor SCL30 isoform X1 n=1 Tax=Ananas comosus TaxID=4615 RepID=A0A6P5GA02_ANACO|nr:serine/arginine-rich SC35-like splicing factor SCL30 isoform X1 [Ananas comosus]XP_020102095.1 serine/arginine-rich SC35-like splicing factor SCL30 isoform X1 [Ananas comosus]